MWPFTPQVGDISSDLAVHLLIAAERFLLDRLKVGKGRYTLADYTPEGANIAGWKFAPFLW